jgi:hypothetical protein
LVINYEKLVENKRIIPLSLIADKVEYIKLESSKECMLGWFSKCYMFDSTIIVNNVYELFKFGKNGKFLQKIGKSGRGPGEIDLIRTISVLPSQEKIVVQKNAESKLLFFNLRGDFIREVHTPSFLKIQVLSNGNFICYDPGPAGFEKYNFVLMSENCDTLSLVKNYNTFSNPNLKHSVGIMGYHLFEPFYSFKNSYFFKTLYNDTVYTTFPSNSKIIPAYFINMGKYKLPAELRSENIDINNPLPSIEKSRPFYFASTFETENFIFIISGSFVGSKHRYLLYDKSSNKGYYLINKEEQSTGFVNDLDGGVDFWPLGTFNGNQLYSLVTILDLKKRLENNEFEKSSYKNPEDQKKLQRLLLESELTDNPILMVVTLKANLVSD